MAKVVLNSKNFTSIPTPLTGLNIYVDNKAGDSGYFYLNPVKPNYDTIGVIIDGQTYYLSDKISNYKWNFDKWWTYHTVESGSVTTDFCRKCQITFYCRSRPEGSHKGRDTGRTGYTEVKVVNSAGVVLFNQRYTWWTYLGGDSKVWVSERVYFDKTFDEPVKVTLTWYLDIGEYIAHIWGSQHHVCVVDNVRQSIVCE